MDFSPLPSKPIQTATIKAWRLSEIIEILLVGLFSFLLLWAFNSVEWAWRIVLIGASLLVFFQVFNFFIQGAQQRAWRYELWERELELLHGVIFKNRRLIPIGAIQFVDTRQGPYERLFGLMSIRVGTAAGEVSIPGLDPATAAELRTNLIAKAGIAHVD